jgi:1-deoxy-D-xylulose-5-phosphate synthase
VVGDDVLTTPVTGGTSANASVSATTTGVTVVDGKSDAAQVANGATRDETFGAHQCHRTDLLPVGVSRELASGDDVALLALGSMVAPALEAARQLADRGIATRVVDLRWAKPLDRAAVVAAARETALVVTIEEGVLSGGVGQGVQAILNEERLASWHKPAGRTVDTITACSQRGLAPVLSLGLPDAFVPHGTRTGLLADLGLDADGIAAAVEEHLL